MINLPSASCLLIFLQIFLYGKAAARVQQLDFVSGEIYGGNFTYFTLLQPGVISLELMSHTGDCDIYVSQYEKKPTFEHNSYCLQSSSCGVDTIIVPGSYKRPLAIGIYGHPSHEVNVFTLNIYQINGTLDDETDELYLTTKFGSHAKESETTWGRENTSYLIQFLLVFFEYLLDCETCSVKKVGKASL